MEAVWSVYTVLGSLDTFLFLVHFLEVGLLVGACLQYALKLLL